MKFLASLLSSLNIGLSFTKSLLFVLSSLGRASIIAILIFFSPCCYKIMLGVEDKVAHFF